MQDLAWDDLRILAAVVDAGSFAAAAARLGQHETTVARRVRRLERHAGQALWLGSDAGLSDAGSRLVAHARAMRDQAAAAQAELEQAAGPVGRVRITAVPWLVDLTLIPNLARWQQRAPDVSVSVLADHGNLSLLHGEADIALRLGRPGQEDDAVTRKLCDVPFVASGAGPGWVRYAPERADVPQAGWSDAEEGPTALRVTDQSSAIAAMRAGLGKAWVPSCAAPDGPQDHQMRTRPLWCVIHPRSQRVPSIRAVLDTFLPLVVATLRG